MTTPADHPDDPSGNGPSSPVDGPDGGTGGPDPGTAPADGTDKITDDDGQTFDRAYVQRLRDEAAAHRVKAKRVDVVTQRLVTAMAAQTNRLADPSDLAFSEDLLDADGLPDPEKVTAAVDDLIARKPHLASRRPQDSDVGQGAQADGDHVSLADLLRMGA